MKNEEILKSFAQDKTLRDEDVNEETQKSAQSKSPSFQMSLTQRSKSPIKPFLQVTNEPKASKVKDKKAMLEKILNKVSNLRNEAEADSSIHSQPSLRVKNDNLKNK